MSSQEDSGILYCHQIKAYIKPDKQPESDKLQQSENTNFSNITSKASKQIICRKTVSGEEYNKTRIMELQDELIKLRKEISLKECNFSKEKGMLYNKIEIINMQSAELKQKQKNLEQINHTLTIALQQKEECEKPSDNNKKLLEEIHNTVEEKNKMLQDRKRNIDILKKEISKNQQKYEQTLKANERQIKQLKQQNLKMQDKAQQRITRLKKILTTLPLQKKMKEYIFHSFNSQESSIKSCNFEGSDYLDHVQFIQRDDSLLNESEIIRDFNDFKKQDKNNKKIIKINKTNNYQRSSNTSKPYLDASRVSSNKISKNNKNKNNSFLNIEDLSYDHEPHYEYYHQKEKILCEMCNKVFEEEEFIEHMDQCRQIQKLHSQKRKIQKKLSDIFIEQRQNSNPLQKKLDNYQSNSSRSGLNIKKADMSNLMESGDYWKPSQKKKQRNQPSKQSMQQLRRMMYDMNQSSSFRGNYESNRSNTSRYR